MKKILKNNTTFILLIFVLFIVYFGIILYVNPMNKILGNFENMKSIELLVSRYNEDLNWLQNEPFINYTVSIYNKSNNYNFYKPPKLKEIVNLENVGVSVHSYFYYIINNYEKLPDIVVFLPGSAMNSHKEQKTLNVINKTIETKNSVFFERNVGNVKNTFYDFKLDEYIVTDLKNRELNYEGKLQNCDVRPFGKWYEHLFKDIDIKHANILGIFSVSKNHILNKSKQYYEELIKYVERHKNEECAHYFERSFLAVFHPIPDECIYDFSF